MKYILLIVFACSFTTNVVQPQLYIGTGKVKHIESGKDCEHLIVSLISADKLTKAKQIFEKFMNKRTRELKGTRLIDGHCTVEPVIKILSK